MLQSTAINLNMSQSRLRSTAPKKEEELDASEIADQGTTISSDAVSEPEEAVEMPGSSGPQQGPDVFQRPHTKRWRVASKPPQATACPPLFATGSLDWPTTVEQRMAQRTSSAPAHRNGAAQSRA